MVLIRNLYSLSVLLTERHFRDAGVALSCQLGDLTIKDSNLSLAMFPKGVSGPLRILELGTGCGMVGITLALMQEHANVLLTDLSEAREIVGRNIESVGAAIGSTLEFQELNWDQVLPSTLDLTTSPFDLVVAADCTYNPDSRY